MKNCLLTAAVVAALAGLSGCGTGVPQAEPKFAEPPRSTLGQADVKPSYHEQAEVPKKRR